MSTELKSIPPHNTRRNLLVGAVLATLLASSTPVHAFWGRFNPCTPGGTVMVSMIDSNAAHWVCISESVRRGDVAGATWLLALTAVGGFVAACALQDAAHPGEGALIAPVSPGLGQVLGVAGTLASPNAILGHELRHLFDDHFHPALFSGVETECGS